MPDPTANLTNDEKPASPIATAPVDTLLNTVISKLKPDDADAKTFETLKAAFEIEKARAEAGKTHADTAKVELDTTLAKRQMRIAILSAMFAPLVPLASLLTVVVTLLVSAEQTRNANQLAIQKATDDKAAREEANWRAFQDEMDKSAQSSPDKLFSTPTFLSKLRTFAASSKYSKEVSDIEFQLMSTVSSDIAFKQLWQLRFTDTNASNLSQVIDLARAKKHQFDSVSVDCKQIKIPANALPRDPTWSYLGACSPRYSIDDLLNGLTDATTVKSAISLRAAIQDLSSTEGFLSNQIGNFIRTYSNKKTGARQLDISNIVLTNVDLEDVDFSLMNLSQTTIFYSRLRGANLLSTATTYDFRGSTWWDADKIDQKILPYLIANLYPNNPDAIYPSGYQIAKDQYVSAISKLCTGQLKICSASCLRFGSEPAPTAPECQLQK